MPVTQAVLEMTFAAESEICFIDGDRGILSYHGFNIHTLADHATFEEVIFLLWHGSLPKQAELDALKADLVATGIPPGSSISWDRAQDAGPMDVLRTAVSMLGLYDPQASDNSIQANVDKAHAHGADRDHRHHVRSFAQRPAGGGRRSHLGFAANFLYTLTGKKPDDVMEHAFDVALILHADHELNASTFAARVTAATLSDIYSAVTSAIGALKGPLHGGANEDVIRMLLAAETKRSTTYRARWRTR